MNTSKELFNSKERFALMKEKGFWALMVLLFCQLHVRYESNRTREQEIQRSVWRNKTQGEQVYTHVPGGETCAELKAVGGGG